MKKLILSAVFALVCFSANAQTTTKVQETPKTKETQPETTSLRLGSGGGGGRPSGCTQTAYGVGYCPGGSFPITVISMLTSGTCDDACAAASASVAAIVANPAIYCNALGLN